MATDEEIRRQPYETLMRGGATTVTAVATAPIAGTSPGIRQVIPTANQDTVLAIPAWAVGRGV